MLRLGPYELIRRLAVGGMAEIFLARREGPGGVAKIVALKRILPHLSENPEFVSMFLAEARIVSRLSHPNVVQLHDFGEIDGTYFLAMEYVPCEDVLAVLRRARARVPRTPPTVVATILAAACEALHYAHELRDEQDRPLGLVHRDVTPSNLLVSYDGVVKLADFGIAKVEQGASGSVTGARKGKYPYMSPEQALGRALDRRSDLFSLAVVGHELVTGAGLFHRENELLVLRAITEDPIPRPSQARSDLPPALERILMRALEREPERRFATAQAMQLELEGFLTSHGQVGWKLSLARYMRELFGEAAATTRRRWAAGEADEEGPTRVLGSASDRGGREGRRGLRWAAAAIIATAAVIALGAVGLRAWREPPATGAASPTTTASATAAPAEQPQARPAPGSPEGSAEARERALDAAPDARSTAAHRRAATPDPAYLTVDRGASLEAELDGHALGTTPIVRRRIKPGRHTLVLRGPEGNRLTSSFSARPGEEHAEKRRLATGDLTCDVAPWAEVYIGDRRLGLTPLASVSLPEGTYTLRLKNADLGREKSLPVTVRAGETTRIKTRFDSSR